MEADSLALRELQGPAAAAVPSRRGDLPSSPGGAGPAAGGLREVDHAPSSEGRAGAPAPRGFWFNVNAELIVYGATEPGARVLLDGIPLRLRPDGTFSLRFALPDGGYRLGFEAVSEDETDRRAARLRFVRQTRTSGRVEAHPQDVRLFPPPSEAAQP